MMRTSYQALTGDFLYPNETFVPDDALIVWHYEFDAKNETELKDFLLNVDSLYRNYDSPYSGLYSITDTVAFKEIATMSSFYTAADVVAAGSSNPGVDGYIVSTDFVKSPSTGEARHYFQWPADSISQFKIDDPTGAGFGDYDEWANPYEIDIQFNKDLITKLSSGGSVKVWYEIVHGGSSNISMGSTYTPGDIFHESDKSVFNRVYRRFEPVDTLVSLHVSSKGRWDVKIDYGTPDLKRSIHGGSWKNAYAPLTDWEQLSVNDGAEIRLRDPGDLCGKIIHFNTYTPPVINHYVEIHSMDDVLKAYPVADQKHYVKGHDDFTFAATFKGEPLKVMAHGYYSGNKTELIGDSIGVNTYQYTIPQITEPFDIRILSEPASEVANKFEDYSSPRVWAHGSTLYIRKEEATEARVYNFSGILVKQLELNSDITTEVMERGAYVVELEGKHYKVIVR